MFIELNIDSFTLLKTADFHRGCFLVQEPEVPVLGVGQLYLRLVLAFAVAIRFRT